MNISLIMLNKQKMVYQADNEKSWLSWIIKVLTGANITYPNIWLIFMGKSKNYHFEAQTSLIRLLKDKFADSIFVWWKF